ncbi:hypothetical protein ATKI12_1365 [Kitasatospora sp. Ki12]|uniref:helix-turn-helix domain-containing protein n=1 Tax=Kitasatospora xanthocidica TaxID=83382 RepID=UPI00167A3823|nr:helix-turn-helix domain-containing protein [Kitasatospora xanthocidica]GHF64504.1 hypothetical protein GCM10018790_47870 [Kitasatospora xanthocidica]
MPRDPKPSPEEKSRIVLDLLAHRITLSAAARQAGVSPQAVSVWRRQFIDGGHESLHRRGRRSEASRRERELLGEISALKAALGEAHLALRSRSY